MFKFPISIKRAQMGNSATKKIWRHIVLSTLMALTITLIPLPAATQTLGIAAVVNDDVISIYDLQARMLMLIVTSNQKDTPELRRRLTRQVLNNLIDEKLKMQEAKRLDIRVPTEALERTYADMEAGNNLPKGGLTQYLSKNGVDRLVLIDQIEATIAWADSINMLFRGQTTISEEEIDEVVNEIKEGKGKPEYLTAEIFLPVNNPAKANEVLNNTLRLIEQLKSGASFSVLARNYSQSASAAVGGDLGWVRQGQLPQEIDKNLIPLRKGEISDPLRSVSGYHIIFKRDDRIGQGIPLSQEKIDLRQVFLPLAATSNESDKTNLMGKAKTMAAGASGCTVMEKLEEESASPLSGSLGVVETSSLPGTIQKVVKGLPVGVASDPIPADGGIIFLMICKRTGTSALDILRPQIRQRLMTERLDNAARGHLRDLRQAAFLDIRI
ncbi:MAG: peptidyl-prolyl cis-trans isomerase [Rhodospirillaceae bacterium]|nr:peptidyl-prolyl cis-trans isomerase [Rhodospirillaceae bacterium]MBT5244214.1 peptidyl-prolyl cis-trans isomerase [Rhodospirillaceae bacterium]MBT5561739.1 peptidyl-prolyl cis-trans isomerase [Rhodospirillaceae bacterium]MBT6243178.1 peptidyl-prolyl cis-trans isomerase [Rhodospirillaceae bacterium]MBT7137429.1 peptidyl-prolyl cis-trans isomerase [Rhodospirillaceae bacterium]